MAASGTAEIQQVGKTSKTYSMKGKEIASRKGKTRPPLNFLSILNNAKKTIDTSCPDKLCEKLYAGVFLKENELKYFVDKKTNKNCFMLFARKLNICWIDDSRYWKWTKEETKAPELLERKFYHSNGESFARAKVIDSSTNFKLSNIKGCYYCFVYERESCSSVDYGVLKPEALVDSRVAHRRGFNISFVNSTLDKTIPRAEQGIRKIRNPIRSSPIR
ncbi:hypothetical protein ACSBR1_002542 [Camellia fascicularis]